MGGLGGVGGGEEGSLRLRLDLKLPEGAVLIEGVLRALLNELHTFCMIEYTGNSVAVFGVEGYGQVLIVECDGLSEGGACEQEKGTQRCGCPDCHRDRPLQWSLNGGELPVLTDHSLREEEFLPRLCEARHSGGDEGLDNTVRPC